MANVCDGQSDSILPMAHSVGRCLHSALRYAGLTTLEYSCYI